MTKQELRPDQTHEVQPPAEQAKEAKKEPTVAEEVKETYRKLEKAKNILHAAGDIEVGQTPDEVLEETRAYRLLHYQQMVAKTAKTPILVVYALINRSYVLDLQSDKSWVRSLLSQGFDVYLIDWKPPTAADKYVSFDDYVNCYIDDCVNTVLKKTKVDKLTLHGYCMGATMSTMYTTLHQEKVRNLAVIAPVVDTEKDTTVIGNLAKNLFVKNELKLGSELIDLSRIKVPLLNIVADEDHLVSPQCSAPLNDVVSSTDKRLMRFHTGHVGLIASLYSQNNVLPKVGQRLKARSQ